MGTGTAQYYSPDVGTNRLPWRPKFGSVVVSLWQLLPSSLKTMSCGLFAFVARIFRGGRIRPTDEVDAAPAVTITTSLVAAQVDAAPVVTITTQDVATQVDRREMRALKPRIIMKHAKRTSDEYKARGQNRKKKAGLRGPPQGPQARGQNRKERQLRRKAKMYIDPSKTACPMARALEYVIQHATSEKGKASARLMARINELQLQQQQQ